MSVQQHEQQYVLRVQDPELATKLARALGTGGKLEDLSLEFGGVWSDGLLLLLLLLITPARNESHALYCMRC